LLPRPFDAFGPSECQVGPNPGRAGKAMRSTALKILKKGADATAVGRKATK